MPLVSSSPWWLVLRRWEPLLFMISTSSNQCLMVPAKSICKHQGLAWCWRFFFINIKMIWKKYHKYSTCQINCIQTRNHLTRCGLVKSYSLTKLNQNWYWVKHWLGTWQVTSHLNKTTVSFIRENILWANYSQIRDQSNPCSHTTTESQNYIMSLPYQYNYFDKHIFCKVRYAISMKLISHLSQRF